MKFLFEFPKELKNDLEEAMQIEKSNFEKQTLKRLSRMERRLAEGMTKITARIGGAKIDVSLPYRWEYNFTSDTTMNLEIETPLDMIILMLRNISMWGDVPAINNLLKKFHINKEKTIKDNENSRNKILKALKKYEEAEPSLKITEVKE